MSSSLASTAIAWGLFFGIGAVGVAITGLGTVRTARRLNPGRSVVANVGVTAAVACGLFLGGWLPLAIWWTLRWLGRQVSRAIGTAP
jgi:hypothetical protein